MITTINYPKLAMPKDSVPMAGVKPVKGQILRHVTIISNETPQIPVGVYLCSDGLWYRSCTVLPENLRTRFCRGEKFRLSELFHVLEPLIPYSHSDLILALTSQNAYPTESVYFVSIPKGVIGSAVVQMTTEMIPFLVSKNGGLESPCSR